jgi:hypothetical protein
MVTRFSRSRGDASVSHWMRALIVVALVLMAVAIPVSALAWGSVFTYAQGYGEPNQWHETPGYTARAWNRVYHLAGTIWWLDYCFTDGSCANNYVGHGENPTVDQRDEGYAEAFCYNQNDTSTVQWTCQTTKP